MNEQPNAFPPEQTFFRDPVIDRLMGMVFSLTAEVQVLRDHVAMTDLLLARNGILTPDDRAAFRPDRTEEAALARESAVFASDVLGPLLGRQASRSEGGPDVR